MEDSSVTSVWLARSGQFYRLGVGNSASIARKLRNLNDASPVGVEFVKEITCDNPDEVHLYWSEKLKPYWHRGDWFFLPPSLRDNFDWFEVPETFPPHEALNRRISVKCTDTEFDKLEQYCNLKNRSKIDVLRSYIRTL